MFKFQNKNGYLFKKTETGNSEGTRRYFLLLLARKFIFIKSDPITHRLQMAYSVSFAGSPTVGPYFANGSSFDCAHAVTLRRFGLLDSQQQRSILGSTDEKPPPKVCYAYRMEN